jgi:hypothetical protein
VVAFHVVAWSIMTPIARPHQMPATATISVASPAKPAPAEPAIARGDWQALVELFVRASPLAMTHWNPRTGEMFALPRGKQRRATAHTFELRLLAESDWIEVPWLESGDAFAMAQAFVDALDPGRARAQLVAALVGPKPFRALRTVLEGHPGLRRKYRRVCEEEAAERLVHTCLALGLRLADPRFDAAAARVQEALDEVQPSPEPCEGPRAVVVQSSALRIGRALKEAES